MPDALTTAALAILAALALAYVYTYLSALDTTPPATSTQEAHQ